MGLIGYDIETGDADGNPVLSPIDGDIWCAGFSDGANRSTTHDKDRMRRILTEHTPVAHNKKFEDRWTREKLGIDISERSEDTMLLAHILGLRPLALKDLAAMFIGGPQEKFREVVKKGVTFNDIPERVRDYCAADAWKARMLYDLLRPQVSAGGWDHVYEFDKGFSNVLGAMEDRGMPVNKERMVAWRQQLRTEMEQDRAILKANGIEEPSKPATYAGMFWQGKDKVVSTKTGLSTTAENLDTYATPEQREWVDALIRWRKDGKFVSTYLDNWIEMGDDGWLHPSFNQTATATARLSCSNPNLQNVTKSTLFQMFVAPPGYKFISCDYSQLELRVLANVSGDRSLIEAYLAGQDMHDLTSQLPAVQRAAKIAYEYTPKDIPFEKFLRDFTKRVNFGIVYGITAYGLAKMLRCSEGQAQAIIDSFYERFPGVATWQFDQKDFARQNLYVPDWFGRPLWVPGMAVDRGSLSHRGEKQTVNYPIQGGGIQVVKEAMVDAAEYLVCQVHDEVLYLVPEAEVEDYGQFLKETLVRTHHEVPYTTDFHVGDTWGDIKSIPEFDASEFAA